MQTVKMPEMITVRLKSYKEGDIITITAHETTCPYCKNPVTYFCIENGILSSSDYDLIADTIFHSSCWNKQIEESPP